MSWFARFRNRSGSTVKLWDRLKARLFRRATGSELARHQLTPISPPIVAESDDDKTQKPVWSVVANVLNERPYGPGGVETRSGTKHFAPGAKVYVIAFYWGMGGESVTVVGKHRKSRRYIRIDMCAGHLANWRTELVYSPFVVRQIIENGELKNVRVASESRHIAGPDTEHARRRAEEIVAGYMERGGTVQPYSTRPPAGWDAADFH